MIKIINRRGGKASYKHIIFDFDGVLAETNTIRVEGFRPLFEGYPQEQLDLIIRYVEQNAGKSRYNKIQHFFEEIRKEAVSRDDVQKLADKYSDLVKQKVVDAEPVKGSLEFLSSHAQDYVSAIVSASDQEELRDVCRQRGIARYFVDILGSPTSKEDNIHKLIKDQEWEDEECLFIGDSVNDLDVARNIGMDFLGRNSGVTDWGVMEVVDSIEDLSQLSVYLTAQ